jgi:phage FluMu protein Com
MGGKYIMAAGNGNVYTFDVTNQTTSAPNSVTLGALNTGTNTSNNISYGNTTTGGYYVGGTWYPYTNWSWPYWNYSVPTTIYKYQVKCPRCNTMNWLELDKITTCTGPKRLCGAKLKAVTKQADYEVPVNA